MAEKRGRSRRGREVTSVNITICGIPHRATLTPDNILVISDSSGFGGPGYRSRSYQFWKDYQCLQFLFDDSRGWSGMASHVEAVITIARSVMGDDHQPYPIGMENLLLVTAEKGIR